MLRSGHSATSTPRAQTPLGGLKVALSQRDLRALEQLGGGALPKLTVRTRASGRSADKTRGGLTKSRSSVDLRRQSSPQPVQPEQQATAPSSPQHSHDSGGSRAEPVQIPLQLSRARTAPIELVLENSGLNLSALSTPLLPSPGSSSSPSQRGGGNGSSEPSPPHRAGSLSKELFAAHGDAVTAQTQVQALQAALRKEQQEVLRLSTALGLMTAERDRLLHELAGGQASAAVFELEDSVAAARFARSAARGADVVHPLTPFAAEAVQEEPGLAPLPPTLPAALPLLTTAVPLRRAGAAGRPSALRLR